MGVLSETPTPIDKQAALERPGAVAYAYNPRTLGDQARRITWAQEFETSLANMLSLLKNIKTSQA